MSNTDANDAKITKMIAAAKEEATKPTSDEIRCALAEEAFRAESVQHAMISAGMIEQPMKSQIEYIVRLDAAVRFFDACKYQPREVARRLNPPRDNPRSYEQREGN